MGQKELDRLLDFVILMDHFNGEKKATEDLARVRVRAAVSVITRAEVLTGFDREPAIAARRLLDCFPTLAIDRAVADHAAELRRSHGWKLPDAFQAAIAMRSGAKLVTRNTRDFPPARHTFVEVPYQL